MERLGLGPDEALKSNPKLVYGRMTGWGQDGPLAPRAGHDINYIALAGVLHAFGRKGEAPVPPLNLVGDFGGGGMLLGFGVACALLEAARSGKGQVVDAAMVEGASLLARHVLRLSCSRQLERKSAATNILDTGAPWYDVYETKDGKYVSIGSIETRFYEELLQKLGVPDLGQHDRARWPEMQGAVREDLQGEDARRVVQGVRGLGRLLRAGAVVVARRGAIRTTRRGRASSRSARRRAARAGAALLAHARRRCGARRPSAARAARQALRDWGFSETEMNRLQSRGLGTKE